MDVYRLTVRGAKAMDLLFEDITDPVELTEWLRETDTDEKRIQLNIL